MLRLLKIRVACMTYRKRPGNDWPVGEFASYEVRLVCGEVVTMLLAERRTFLGRRPMGKEFRRLTDSGHQTQCSHRLHQRNDGVDPAMFARWSQENFFGYMRKTMD